MVLLVQLHQKKFIQQGFKEDIKVLFHRLVLTKVRNPPRPPENQARLIMVLIAMSLRQFYHCCQNKGIRAMVHYQGTILRLK